jgi:hypothetical protein
VTIALLLTRVPRPGPPGSAGEPTAELTVWAQRTTALTTTRHLGTVKDLDDEVVNERVWIGFHYRHSGIAGVRLGREVAHRTRQRYFGPPTVTTEEDSDGG